MARTISDIAVDIYKFGRFAVRRFYDDRMNQAAGALTYSTLLALVPLLVIAFAVLSGFPAFDAVKERMEDMVFSAILPEIGDGVRDYLDGFTANASNLTAVGIVALAVTAVLLLFTIESTLNLVWRVERERPLVVRLLIFWAILTLGPLLLGASFTFTSDMLAVMRHWGAGESVIDSFDASASYARVIVSTFTQSLCFTLLFLLVPARKVALRDAAIGGVFAGIAFQILKWFFNSFFTSGSTYQTIYGAVSIFPIFLLWIYLSWTVIILGAVVAAALPDWWRTRDVLFGLKLTPAERLEVAVALLSLLAARAVAGGGAPPKQVAEEIPLDARDEMTERLTELGYIVTTEEGDLCLARDLHQTRLIDLVHELELSLGQPPASPAGGAKGREIMESIRARTGRLPDLLRRLDGAEGELLSRPLVEIIDLKPAPPPPVRLEAARDGRTGGAKAKDAGA